MTVNVGDFIRVVAKMTDINGSIIENVYYWHHVGTNPITDTAFMAGVETKLSTMYELIDESIADSVTPFEIEADRVAYVSGKLVTQANVGTIEWTSWSGGESTSDGLPQQDAQQINFSTAEAGVQGRKYIGPLTEGIQANGNLIAAAVSRGISFAAEYLSPGSFSGETFESGVMSDKVNNFVQFVGAVARGVIASQRRRKVGRGV